MARKQGGEGVGEPTVHAKQGGEGGQLMASRGGGGLAG
jgi:hypothetical protein